MMHVPLSTGGAAQSFAQAQYRRASSETLEVLLGRLHHSDGDLQFFQISRLSRPNLACHE